MRAVPHIADQNPEENESLRDPATGELWRHETFWRIFHVKQKWPVFYRFNRRTGARVAFCLFEWDVVIRNCVYLSSCSNIHLPPLVRIL